jgi:hypothetical protein
LATKIKEERGKSRRGERGRSDVDSIIPMRFRLLALWEKDVLYLYIICYITRCYTQLGLPAVFMSIDRMLRDSDTISNCSPNTGR